MCECVLENKVLSELLLESSFKTTTFLQLRAILMTLFLNMKYFSEEAKKKEKNEIKKTNNERVCLYMCVCVIFTFLKPIYYI